MSQDELSRKGQDILQIVGKAKEFTEELLKENERLRFKIASLEASGWAQKADERVKSLDRPRARAREQAGRARRALPQGRGENKEFADRYIEIEEQNNNLANLYVASYQLHSTLDFREVVRIVQEIVINLIGAEVFHVLMVSEKTGQLEIEASEGQTPARTTIPVGDGLIGKAAQSGENYFAPSVARRDPSPFEEPLAGDPAQDQGLDDRAHLDQQAAGPEDAVHLDGLRAVHAARRPRSDRDLLRQALLDLGPQAHDAPGLPGHAQAEAELKPSGAPRRAQCKSL
jgi:hypothetical protein